MQIAAKDAYKDVCGNFIRKSPKGETSQMSVENRMDNRTGQHSRNGIVHSNERVNYCYTQERGCFPGIMY